MNSIRYQIYPSMLDRYQAFIDSDLEAEAFWNVDRNSGELKRTPDEIAAKNEQSLIDMINRVPSAEPIEAADKGTAFNEIVDYLISGELPERKDLKITQCYLDGLGGYYNEGMGFDKEVYMAEINGFTFDFCAIFCREAADYFKNKGFVASQHFCKGVISTAYGDVLLYGYIDEIVKDIVYDIKTTSYYSFPKFDKAWQRLVYPYCLVNSGQMEDVSEFEFTVFQLTKPSSRTPWITGTRYLESYTYNHEEAEKEIRLFIERFIEWLEANRNKITDKKVFNVSDQ